MAIEASETTWNLLGIALPMLQFQANLLFTYVSILPGRLAGTLLRNFSCMVTTSCMSVAISNIAAEWLVEGNITCNILRACYRCFLYMYQITIALQVRLRFLRLEFQV